MKVKPVLMGLIFAITLLFLFSIKAEGSAIDKDKVSSDVSLTTQALQIIAIKNPTGDYFVGDTIQLEVKLSNITQREAEAFIVWQIQDDLKKQIVSKSLKVQLNAKKTENYILQNEIPKEISSGMYNSSVQVLMPPAQFDAVPLLLKAAKNIALRKVFGVFRFQEDFNEFDSSLWKKSTHKLGLSQLNPERVQIEEDSLKMTFSADCFEGAEIQSVELMNYGMYEARLKLPKAPSSITGFFLYAAPDFYNEIDIEIKNDPSGVYYLTTYAGGKVSNQFEGKLNFDPTEGFHQYRILRSKSGVSFYVDGKLMKKWTKNLPESPMHLMLNTWFPSWLDGKTAPQDTTLIADWIRY